MTKGKTGQLNFFLAGLWIFANRLGRNSGAAMRTKMGVWLTNLFTLSALATMPRQRAPATLTAALSVPLPLFVLFDFQRSTAKAAGEVHCIPDLIPRAVLGVKWYHMASRSVGGSKWIVQRNQVKSLKIKW